MIKVLLIIGSILTVIAVAMISGRLRWHFRTRCLFTYLAPGIQRNSATFFESERDLNDLPEPVKYYFKTALSPGQPLPYGLKMHHRGTFNMDESGEQWKSFTAQQHVNLISPGFLWDARINMFPGLKAYVHDAYIRGEGILYATLGGLITVANSRGTPELARGERMRYLAEAPWYPTALLPQSGVRWHAVDEHSARATLGEGPGEVTLLFRFDPEYRIASVFADDRGRMVNGATVPTPWEGRWSQYERRFGMLVPVKGEVAWIINGKYRPYWRGELLEIEYEFHN
ncbi:MAG TPA: DUF6544 family protein [Bacteroidales bacterium]|nr:DUF6544 family protein [Bacteroidales bacterium]